jgi:hypothetical protein
LYGENIAQNEYDKAVRKNKYNKAAVRKNE